MFKSKFLKVFVAVVCVLSLNLIFIQNAFALNLEDVYNTMPKGKNEAKISKLFKSLDNEEKYYTSSSIKDAFDSFLKTLEYRFSIDEDSLNSVYLSNNLRNLKGKKFSLNSAKNKNMKMTLCVTDITSDGANLLFFGEDDETLYLTTPNFVIWKINSDDKIRYLYRNEGFSEDVLTFRESYSMDITWADIYKELENGEYILSKDIAYLKGNTVKKGVINVKFKVSSERPFKNIFEEIIKVCDNVKVTIYYNLTNPSITENKEILDLEKRNFIQKMQKELNERMWADSKPFVNKYFNYISSSKGGKSYQDFNNEEKNEYLKTIEKFEEQRRKALRDFNSLKASGILLRLKMKSL